MLSCFYVICSITSRCDVDTLQYYLNEDEGRYLLAYTLIQRGSHDAHLNDCIKP